MSLEMKVYPYKPDYPEVLRNYLDQMREAIRQNKHHDHRRHLFTDFLRKAYDVDPGEVEIEEKIKVANIKGYIDALFKCLIVEFKTYLDRERPAALIELQKYFLSQKRPEEYLALVTDGIDFEVYQLEQSKVARISSFVLDESDPLASYRHLDNLIFASKKVTPKSVDITTRFGPFSAVFNRSRSILHDLFDAVKKNSSVEVKFDEWNSLLARVYGERIGDENLFLKHTYLTMFSRLLVLNALSPSIRRTKSVYRGLLTGSFFTINNLPNLAETDFFSWALGTEVEDGFIGLLAKVDKYLDPYRLDNISEDILKEIYQELVDPESRHSLGEYYTPDWIADIAVEAIDYKDGRILDPACGSGTFFLAVIRRFRKQSLSGKGLVNKVLGSVLGFDVHPLAVMMSKANILLGLAAEIKQVEKELYIPIYMSDTLMTSEDKKTNSIRINVSADESFFIPLETTFRDINVDQLIDRFAHVCEKSFHNDKTRTKAWKGFQSTSLESFSDHEIFLWKQNYKLFTKLIGQKRNTIWAFILKNAYRPAYVRRNRVDYVVGNPPWLAYRYIKDKNYKAQVKDLTLDYGLLNRDAVKLFTHMDTSTLFFIYSERHFLKEGGKIAFVLPKTTVLPAQQHTNFQNRGLTGIHDFSGVSPLFNVRSVLAIRDPKKVRTTDIPEFKYDGRLPVKNMAWETARKHLTVTKTKRSFPSESLQRSYYYPHFLQGATIVPRSFWFIQKDKNAATHKTTPYLETSDDAFDEAKTPWKRKVQGRVEKRFFYETLLAKGLIPFGIMRTELLFLPVRKRKHSFELLDSSALLEHGFLHAASWMQDAEKLWEEHRQSSDRSLVQRLNYHQLLSKQNLDAPFVVLYNTSGTNLTAALFVRREQKGTGFKSHGFFAGHITYYHYPKSLEEGYYLCAVLNSDIVNLAIKELQPQGLYGERHICRRPFEVCAIPQFDLQNPIHIGLAKLGEKCSNEVKGFIPHLQGRLGKLRLEVKRVLKPEMDKINKLVKELLAEEGQNSSQFLPENKRYKNSDLFE